MPKRHRWLASGTLALVTAAASLVVAIGTASGHGSTTGVVPTTVSATLAPGQSLVVDKVVHTLAIPPLVDVFLLEDETGSFSDDIATLQSLAAAGGPLITALNGTGANYATGVAGFRDFAQSFWGNTGDWVYRLLANIQPGGAGFVAGVPSLTAGGGADGPEADLEALHYLADTSHAAIDSNGDGDTTDANDTPAGQQPSWRSGAKRVVLLATDAPCHVTGDAGGWPGDSGTTSAATTAGILSSNNIIVIGLTPAGAGTISCVDDLASGTGGSVHATTASGSDIVNAIMAGLSNLPVTVTPVATCGPGVSVSFDVPSKTVTSGDDAVFVETITAATNAPQGTTVTCTVDFQIDGHSAGPQFVETITIRIPDVTRPTARCVETTNPAGNKVPPAGSTTLPGPKGGQNEDGFYQVFGSDNVGVASIEIRDSASSFVSSPLQNGDKVKVTQAPGATPNEKPMAGVIVRHITTKGDPVLRVTDTSGNVTEVSCKVPPPPK